MKQSRLRGPAHPILCGPVQQVVNDQALHHGMLRSIVGAKGAAADAAVRLQPVVVRRHNLVQHRVPAVRPCSRTSMQQ